MKSFIIPKKNKGNVKKSCNENYFSIFLLLQKISWGWFFSRMSCLCFENKIVIFLEDLKSQSSINFWDQNLKFKSFIIIQSEMWILPLIDRRQENFNEFYLYHFLPKLSSLFKMRKNFWKIIFLSKIPLGISHIY